MTILNLAPCLLFHCYRYMIEYTRLAAPD